MLIPGQVENWIMILNFGGSSPLNMPNVVKKMINILSENFLSRLYKCYVYGMSFIINLMFKLICNFLEEVTVQKINIIDKKNMNKIYENIRKDNLEEKFGGTAPNIKEGINNNNSLFPPRMPSSNFILEDKNEILITKEEYIRLVEEKKIKKEYISPFILKEIEIEIYKREKEKISKIENKLWIKQWKLQNEFEGKNKINNINKNSFNIVNDIKLFNNAKYSFHKSINILNGNK